MFEAALVSGLVASGADAYMLHVIPTPGVAHQTVEGCFDCGIMISASHNPFCDNGIKLVNSDGFKMDEDVLELIEDYIDGKSEVPLATGNHIGATVDYMQGRNRYIASLIASANFSLQGVKIGIDCANGSASSVAKPVFDALGADVRVINAAPDGFNINVDCGSTHIERLQRHVVEQGLDVGFAYDGDADRCLAVDERGRVVDGDQILYVCGVYLNKHGRLSGGTVVPTIASNFGLIKSLELAGLSAVTSGVGDRHVYAKMREGGYSLGGEQTGHTIFGDIERTGDGIMTSLRVMEVIRAERETLSQLTAPCKLLPQAQVAVHVADKDAALENMGVQNAIAEAEACAGRRGPRARAQEWNRVGYPRAGRGARPSIRRCRHEAHRKRSGALVTRLPNRVTARRCKRPKRQSDVQFQGRDQRSAPFHFTSPCSLGVFADVAKTLASTN